MLKELTGKLAEKTLYGGDALFLLGACQTQLSTAPMRSRSLERFLKQYPEAPERLRVGAFRQLEELKAMKNGSLVDVEDRMVFSRRKLSLEDAGDQTREEQGRIVAMLDKLIKEAEDREAGRDRAEAVAAVAAIKVVVGLAPALVNRRRPRDRPASVRR